MKFPAEPAKNRFVRDYQVIEFEGPGELIQGQTNTYLFNFPFRFIAEEMVCEAFFQDQSIFANQTFTPFVEPPILTQMKYHSTFIDDQPLPLRAAWGTALRPAKLPIPWAVEQGTNVSVDAQCILPFVGPIVIFGQSIRLVFSLRGYQPSDAEFADIKARNDEICVRPYQSFTFQNRSGLPFMIAKDPSFGWDVNVDEQFNIDFPMDIFVVKNTGNAFDIDNLDVNNFPVNLPDPVLSMTLVTKSANLFSTRDVFRNIFGTAEFPTQLMPNAQFKQGDFARLNVKNNSQFKVAPFMSIIGYAPKPGTIRRGDIQRGRVKPEQYDPQPMIGGRVGR